MGLIIPKVGYLESLMKLAKKYKTLVIFDEVISGFRLSIGGAQSFYNLRPDLTCIGKVIGGGFPIGAFGGRRDIMSMLSPSGPVYHAGTLSGNPVAVSAGIKTLEILKKRKAKLYKDLDNKGKYIKEQVEKKGFKSITINQLGSMLTIFFNSNKIENYSDVLKCDTKIYGAFFNQLLSSGIMLAPSQFEAMFLSTEHSKEDLDYTISKLIEALDNLGIK
jgi:glutamate-1-semialdehyde 2,1-aminomutase